MGTTRTSVVVFYALLVTTVVMLLWLCSSFLGPIALALVLYVLFEGFNRWLVQLFGGRRSVASLTTTLLIVLLVVIPLSVLTVLLASQAHSFYLRTRETALFGEIFGGISSFMQGKDLLPERISALLGEIGLNYEPEALAKIATDTLGKVALFISDRLGNLANFASDVIGVALNFCIMVTVCYALFLNGSQLRDFIAKISLLPKEEENAIVDRFKQVSKTVFIGNGVASLIQGVFVGILFWAFDVGPGILFGAVSTILAFLPLVGISFVFIPATVVLFFIASPWQALAFLALNIGTSLVVEYWLKSKLIGGEEMNPVVAFLAIIAGIKLFGLMGLFYGPLIVTMFLAFIDIYQTRYRTVSRGKGGEEYVELTPPPVPRLVADERVAIGGLSSAIPVNASTDQASTPPSESAASKSSSPEASETKA